jgi:peptidoglycan/xylan/chitin deacetylase (PgdA/CDA1 family)
MNTYTCPRILLLLLALCCALMCKSAQAEQVRSENKTETKAEGGAFVLCYHAFLDHPPHDLTFPIRQLDLQMKTLKDAGFNFITTEDLIAGSYEGVNNILITVDDGNKSVHRAYFEVFKKYGIKPLLGIYPHIINRMSYALTWEELAELQREGCHIAGHGYFHLYLFSSNYRSNRHDTRNEVIRPKQILESRLGIDINVFVYPFGSRSPEVIRLLKETGYTHAFTIEHGVIYTTNTNINRFELPRYLVANSNVHQIFSMLFRAIGKTYEPIPELRAPPRGR